MDYGSNAMMQLLTMRFLPICSLSLFSSPLLMPMLIISRPAIVYISGTEIVCYGAVFCFVLFLVSYVVDHGPGLLSTTWYMQIMEVDDSRRFFV